jgi:hypothetical protein
MRVWSYLAEYFMCGAEQGNNFKAPKGFDGST